MYYMVPRVTIGPHVLLRPPRSIVALARIVILSV